MNILKFIKLNVAEMMDWLIQYPVQLPSGMFSCTGGWKTKSHSQTGFQLESTIRCTLARREFGAELSGEETGHKVATCAHVNCHGDGRAREPPA